MRSKVGAWVLLGGMLLPGAIQAEEPNPEAAKVIEQIEARRAEKAAAEAKSTTANSPTGRSGGSPYANPGQGWNKQ